MKTKRYLTLLLALCLALTVCVPALAYCDRTTSEAGLSQLKAYEGFRAQKYTSGGKWYIGYGTQCGEDDYPDGISQEEAENLLREKVLRYEAKLNEFFLRYDIEPTQGQFDALICFTYNFGTSWLTGTSDLVQIVRGEKSATRLEVAQAFGIWCHVGGNAEEGLARRRLEEASLYLDGTLEAAETEFAYLIIEREDGATYATDFAVYEIGESYGAFPAMDKLGYTFAGLETGSGETLTEDSIVTGSATVRALWNRTVYSGRTFSDVLPGHWYYNYVMDLTRNGVVNGNPDGTFAPERAITAGETLKLVLLAAGHTEQTPTGEHWAGGYGTYALSMGYLAREQVADLDGAMKRADVARLAAKAIGYGASNGESPFDDTSDGYVTALYEVGVLTGSEENGQLVFRPDSGITRAEAAAVVWRLYRLAASDTKQKIRYSSYTLDVLEGVPVNRYEPSAFSRVGSVMYYNDPSVRTRLGIDVSQYQSEIDWRAVADSGVEFAIVRVGGRGYTEGAIYGDTKFAEHAAGAAAAGLQVGAYFFSQAISVEEAIEEAYYVLEQIKDAPITGPVVFDWEVIGKSEARTYGIETKTLCDCANTFCGILERAGYEPMIYFNNYAGYVKYDLREILPYDFWYAQYNTDSPGFYYDIQMWQYTSKGSVPGIQGSVDMDLWFIR